MVEVRKGAGEYAIRRRYKDFDSIYTKLCDAYGRQAVPPVPPKQLLKNENDEFLEVRCRHLQLRAVSHPLL